MKISKYVAAWIFFIIYAVLNMLLSSSAFPGAMPGSAILYVRDADSLSMQRIAEITGQHGVSLYLSTVQTIMKPDRPLEYQNTVITLYTPDADREAVWDRCLGLHPGEIRIANGDRAELRADTPDVLDQDPELRRLISRICLTGDRAACDKCMRELRSDFPEAFTDAGIMSWSADLLLPAILLGLLLILLLFWCYLDSSFLKKEIAIRVLHGDAPMRHYLRSVLTDTIVFSALFLLCCGISKMYSQICLPFRRFSLLFLPFLVGVWIVYLHLLKIRPKEMVYGHQLSGGVLRAVSVLSHIAAIFSCFVILAAAGIASNVKKYDGANAFIRSKLDYTYISFQMSPEMTQLLQKDEIDAFMKADYEFTQEQRRFLRENDAGFQPVFIQDLSYQLEDYGLHVIWDAIYCNHRALSYLQTLYPEAAEIDLSKYDAALLLPDTFPELETHRAKIFLLDNFSTYEGYLPQDSAVQICYYHSDVPVMSFDFNYQYFGYHDLAAICIASDSYSRPDAEQLMLNHHFLLDSGIFRIPPQVDTDALLSNYSAVPVFRSVSDKFYDEYRKRQVYLISACLISVLMLVFYISEIYTVLKLDYQVHATELAIRKTLGESMLQKNRRYFVGAAAVGAVNLILAVVLSHFIHLFPLAAAIAVPVVMFALNILLIGCMIRHVEKQKLTKILKGGAL